MSHDVGLDLWRSRKQDLTSDGKAVLILNARQVTGSVSYAVENDLRALTEESMIQMFEFASEELNVEGFELALQILDVSRRVDGYRSERDAVSDTWDELIRGQDAELPATSATTSVDQGRWQIHIFKVVCE